MASLFGSHGGTSARSADASWHRKTQRSLRIENLEHRQLMSATGWNPVQSAGGAISAGDNAPLVGRPVPEAPPLTGTWCVNGTDMATITQNGSSVKITTSYRGRQFTDYGSVDHFGNIVMTSEQIGSVGLPLINQNGVAVESSTRILWNNDAAWEKVGAEPDWYDKNLPDWSERSIVHRRDYEHNGLTRNDMIDILRVTERDHVVSGAELTGLQDVIHVGSGLKMADSVRVLSDKLVLGDPANAHYQGGALGNLHVGSSDVQMEELIGKWFLGKDHPVTPYTYQVAAGKLSNGSFNYTDVEQGALGDCYFLATLAETALQKNSYIASMFTDNGDGTYMVRFYHNGTPDYVTVDRALPTLNNLLIYDGMGQSVSDPNNVLWAALAEKAYAQLNESGWLDRPAPPYATYDKNGINSYDAIGWGAASTAMSQVTPIGASYEDLSTTTNVLDSLGAAFNAGKLVELGSKGYPYSPKDSSVAESHAYAVVGYSPTNHTLTLFNPWGVNGGYDESGVFKPGYVTLTSSQLLSDFDWGFFTSSAMRAEAIVAQTQKKVADDHAAAADSFFGKKLGGLETRHPDVGSPHAADAVLAQWQRFSLPGDNDIG